MDGRAPAKYLPPKAGQVSNRGLRAGLVGTPEQVRARIQAYEDAGLDLLLLQMSPQAEEMERFAAQVMQGRCGASARLPPARPTVPASLSFLE